MEKYPYLNEAIAHVLSRRRAELAMSKKKLSEEAMIARIHITALEAGTQCPSMNVVFYCRFVERRVMVMCPSMNVVFYLSEALDMKPDVFVREVMEEIECFKSKERERTHGIRR